MRTFSLAALTLLVLSIFPIRKAYSDASPPLTVLTPQGWFDVPSVDGVPQVAEFRARGGYLYFLLRNKKLRDGALSVILKTDTHGTVISRLDYPGALLEMDVDLSGDVVARHAQLGRPFAILVWDANGNPKQTFSSEDATGRLGFHRGELVTLEGSNITPVDPSSNRPAIPIVTPPLSWAPSLVSLVPVSKTRTMMIGSQDAIVSVIDGYAVVRRVLLETPEIRRSPQDDPNSGDLRIFGTASGDSGRAYVALTGYTDRTGPTVLQLDGEANFLRRYRCAPPSDVELKELLPDSIAATGSSLFIVSSSLDSASPQRHVVAWYSIDN